MSRFWRALEDLLGPAAVAEAWRRRVGEEFATVRPAFLQPQPLPATSHPCPHECGCWHEVVRHEDGSIVGVCRCDPWACDTFPLTEADLVVHGLNLPKLSRALARALGYELRDAELGPRRTRQIGSFSSQALPVVLTLQRDRVAFHSAVAELVAVLQRPFALFAPTARLIDLRSQQLLARCGAEFYALEGHVTLLPSGLLHARQSAGELFAPLLPAPREDLSDAEARRLYGRVLLACDADAATREAPLKRVFDLYCVTGFSAQEVAVRLKCAKSTVMNRLAKLREMTGVSAEKLRAYKPLFERIEESLADPRARRLRRTDAIYGDDPADDPGEDSFILTDP